MRSARVSFAGRAVAQACRGAALGVALLALALAVAAPASAAGKSPPAKAAATKAAAREPVPKDVPQPPAPRVIVLLRHAQYGTDPNADPKLGPGLTPLGFAQAHLAAARIAGLPYRFDAIHASPLTRAQDTARIVAVDLGGASFDTVPELEECTPPSPRLNDSDRGSDEEMAACAKRLDALFAARFVPAAGSLKHELLVCHGNVIRYLVTKALGVDNTTWLGMSLGHTSLTTIRVEADGTMQVIAAGDVGHLPPSMLTGARGDGDRALAPPK